MIKEFLKGEDPWQQRKVGGDDVVVPGVPGKELSSKEDELKPMHHKDIKPPPELSGARKDCMAWHESFASMLRCKTPKWAKVIDWIKSRKETRIIGEAAQAEYEKTIGTSQFDKYIAEKLIPLRKHLYRYL